MTVLLFREGSQLNLYHVLEKPDGSYSPLSDSWSESVLAAKKDIDDEDSEEEEESEEVKGRLRENAVTMNKMSDLKTQMEQLSMIKKDKVGCSTILLRFGFSLHIL